MTSPGAAPSLSVGGESSTTRSVSGRGQNAFVTRLDSEASALEEEERCRAQLQRSVKDRQAQISVACGSEGEKRPAGHGKRKEGHDKKERHAEVGHERAYAARERTKTRACSILLRNQAEPDGIMHGLSEREDKDTSRRPERIGDGRERGEQPIRID